MLEYCFTLYQQIYKFIYKCNMLSMLFLSKTKIKTIINKIKYRFKCIFVNNNTVLSQMFIFQQGAIQQTVYTWTWSFCSGWKLTNFAWYNTMCINTLCNINVYLNYVLRVSIYMKFWYNCLIDDRWMNVMSFFLH